MQLERFLSLVLRLPALALVGCASVPSSPASSRAETVLFLCPHGGAKSVVAAAYFDRAAREAGLPLAAIAAASEDPYDAVPAPVVERLEGDNFCVRQLVPRSVTRADLDSAARVILIDCELPPDLRGATTELWSDVPKISEDLEGSVVAIERHVAALVEELRGRR